MTKQDVAALACRILGVYTFLKALDALQFVGLGWMSLNSLGLQGVPRLFAAGSALAYTVLPIFLFTVAGCFLWVKADWLARRMTADAGMGQEASWDGRALLPTAIAVVGLVVLVEAVPHLCELMAGLWLQARAAAATNAVMAATGAMTPDRAARMFVQEVTLAVQVPLGLWLLLGAQGIATFLRARQRGPAAEDQSAEGQPAIEIAAR